MTTSLSVIRDTLVERLGTKIAADTPAVLSSDAFRLGCYASAKHAGATHEEAVTFVRGLDQQSNALSAFRLGAFATAKKAGVPTDAASTFALHVEKLAFEKVAIKPPLPKFKPKPPKPQKVKPTQPMGQRLGEGIKNTVGQPVSAFGGFLGNVMGGMVGPTRGLSAQQMASLAKLKKGKGVLNQNKYQTRMNDLRGQGFAVDRGAKPATGTMANVTNWMRDNKGATGGIALGVPAAGGAGAMALSGGAEATGEAAEQRMQQRMQQQLELMRMFALMGGGRGMF